MGLKLFYYYKIALLNEWLGFPVKQKALRDAIKAAFTTITYRFPISAPKDTLISLRILKLLLVTRFKKINYESHNTGHVAIFDVSKSGSALRRNYIKRLSGEDASVFISRDDLMGSPRVVYSILFLILLLVIFPFVVLISVFSKDKLKYPFHLLNAIEAFNLLWILRKHQIKKLHFFCIYESDANILAYALMKNGIEVNKIPSEVPMQFLNRTVVADTLSFCFRYQEEEFKLYNSTMHVGKIQHWIPEGSFKLEAIYNTLSRETVENTIGFYSSGMWLRSEIDTMDLVNADEYEKELLQCLVEFITLNTEYKLIIFLHPLEKRNIDKAKQYYEKFSVPFEFADISIQNSELFKSADVVVSLYSTLAFERIFWGFKTIIYPLGQTDFPISNSVFCNTCAKTRQDLFSKLKLALETDTNVYFENNGIASYRYLNYNCFNQSAA